MNKWSIIFMGNLIVNLPVTVVIIGVAIFLINYFDANWNLSLIIGVIIGWYLWGKLVNKWVLYCLNKGASKEEIFKAGKNGLVNFSRHKVYDVEIGNY
ncbi:MAG: hypothetical protein BroJett020_02300 [Bacteroidota bacterium]|nr:MAG: hypothetical protein BroJett020_02300 [Bacteroidota bacterium]